MNIPTTYAGGAYGRRSICVINELISLLDIKDLKLVQDLSHGKVNLTYGSALDIFGGGKVKFMDCVAWNKST